MAIGDEDALSIRDYFAVTALKAFLSQDGLAEGLSRGEGHLLLQDMATMSYFVADAMMKSRGTFAHETQD